MYSKEIMKRRRRTGKANDVIIYAVMGKTEGGQMTKPRSFFRHSSLNFVACTFPDNEDISKLKW